jgi:hypothetical protein
MSTARTQSSVGTVWTWKHSAGVLSICLLIVLVGFFQAPTSFSWARQAPSFVRGMAKVPSLTSWLFYLGLMVALTVIVSDGLTGSRRGILIDDRNRISLSRFQTVLWTFLILSAFFAAGIGNAFSGDADPLGIGIPETVWALMGISTVSLVGTPLILSGKRTTAPPTAHIPQDATSPMLGNPQPLRSWKDQLQAQGVDTSSLGVQGSVVLRDDAAGATWAELFRGDEVANIASLDLSKIQMFLFMIVLAITYAIALGSKFIAVDRARAAANPNAATPAVRETGPKSDPKRVDEFPPLDTSIVMLLGISNAGYLANKAIPRPHPAS